MLREVFMTESVIFRGDVFSRISQKRLKHKEAADILGLSERHIGRLYAEFKKHGIASLVSQQRGKPSNHQLPDGIKSRVQELITIDLYSDFGPTFMREKLEELHGIKIGIETTRQIMIKNGVWEVHRKKCPVVHQQRKRRAHFGELEQIDGSPHAWFEERGEPCVLITFVDDATGQTYGRFFKSETTIAYMITLKLYILKYGRPLALYSDKHSIFRINKKGLLKEERPTQFARACRELDIEAICASSAPAKGRVERNHQTQQDRLVKELRIRGISTTEAANKFLEEVYWDTFNAKFAIAPRSPENSHRELLPEHNLKRILAIKKHGTLSKNLEVQYAKTIYQIELKKPSWRLRGAKVTIIKTIEGEIFIEHNGKDLPYKILTEQRAARTSVNPKELDTFFLEKEKRSRDVPKRHPWKREARAAAKLKAYKTAMKERTEI